MEFDLVYIGLCLKFLWHILQKFQIPWFCQFLLQNRGYYDFWRVNEITSRKIYSQKKAQNPLMPLIPLNFRKKSCSNRNQLLNTPKTENPCLKIDNRNIARENCNCLSNFWHLCTRKASFASDKNRDFFEAIIFVIKFW